MIWEIIAVIVVFAISVPIALWLAKGIEKIEDDYQQMQQNVKDIKKRLEDEDNNHDD